jgi:hypothetical protein
MDSFPDPRLSVNHANQAKPQTPFQSEYERYIRWSPRWKALSRAAEIKAGGKCDLCGWRKGTECAHLTYERLYNERLTDVLWVCHECHWKLDESLRHGR